MKRILSYCSLLIGLLYLASCTDGIDIGGGDPMNDLPPTVSISFSSDNTLDGSVLGTGESISIVIRALSGDNPLNSFSVKENNVLVDAARITINEVQATANPVLLFNAEKTEFEYHILVVAPQVAGEYDYSFEVMDEANMSASTTLSITVNSEPPVLSNLGSSEITVPPGTLVQMNIKAEVGSAPLQYLVIADANGPLDDVNNWYFGDINTALDANPYPLGESDKQGFEKQLYVRTPDVGGNLEFRIFVIDELEEGAYFDIQIFTGTTVGLKEGVLFNAAGPQGTGGLDLDTGMGVGSNDSAAEIKDEGIDIDLPLSQNWLRQLSGVNNSEIRLIRAGVAGISENYLFDNVQFAEEIIGLFEAGMQFIDTNNDGEAVSPIVVVGDSYAVKGANGYYLIRITQIVETLEDNGDHYVIDIKS